GPSSSSPTATPATWPTCGTSSSCSTPWTPRSWPSTTAGTAAAAASRPRPGSSPTPAPPAGGWPGGAGWPGPMSYWRGPRRVAVDLAARDGARGLVLTSTFTSLPDVAANHFPLLPVHALMRTRLDSVSKIRDYHGPLLQAHGDADRVVPYALGRKLFEAANEP